MTALDLIGTQDAAGILEVSPRTVKRLAMSGELPHAVKMPGDTGAYLFIRRDVERLRAERERRRLIAAPNADVPHVVELPRRERRSA